MIVDEHGDSFWGDENDLKLECGNGTHLFELIKVIEIYTSNE